MSHLRFEPRTVWESMRMHKQMDSSLGIWLSQTMKLYLTMIHPKAAVSTNGEWESSTKDAVSSLLRNWGPNHVQHIRSVDAQFQQTCFEEAPNSQRHHALGVHTNSSSPWWFLFLIPIYLMVRPRLKPHYTLFPGKHTFWQIHPRHGNNDSELNCQIPCNSDQCYCIPISWHLDRRLSQKKMLTSLVHKACAKPVLHQCCQCPIPAWHEPCMQVAMVVIHMWTISGLNHSANTIGRVDIIQNLRSPRTIGWRKYHIIFEP